VKYGGSASVSPTEQGHAPCLDSFGVERQDPSVQILSNIIPGLREIRAPLIAGYIWLIVAWVLVRPDLDTRPSDEVFGSVYDLGHEVGPIAVVAAASVSAYLIGCLSQVLTEALLTRVVTDRATGLRGRIREFMGIQDADPIPPIPLERIDRAYARGQAAIDELGRGIADRPASRLSTSALNELDARRRTARSEALRELERPATLLVGDQPELFSEVDRLRAEGDLRLAVVLPLAALVSVFAANQSWLWFLAVPLIVILGGDGLAKLTRSQAVIAHAVALNKVRSPSQDDFDTWIARFADDVLLGRRNRALAGLEIVRAVWRSDEDHSFDVTERLRTLINNGRLTLQVENDDLGGDPDPGAAKTLEIEYVTIREVGNATVAEHDRVELPPPQQ
jgi:hypothetical protein